MQSSVILPAVIFLLVIVCGGLLWVVLFPGEQAALNRRVELMSATGTGAKRRAGTTEEARRKSSVETSLREADKNLKLKANSRDNPPLSIRMRQADLGWSSRTFYAICAGIGMVVFLLILGTTGVGIFVSLGFGIAAGLLLPRWYVRRRRNRRFKKFSTAFPDAVDVIVRGIKSGLPLVDCMKIISNEAEEPVRGEFRAVIADQAVGLPLADAIQRLPERVPISEVNFFAIVMAIQSRTGGSLSEALGNLSRVLRERKKMRQKIQAMSGEAKASAMIIGLMPLMVIVLLYFSSPAYIMLLFSTQIGIFVLVGCALLMLCGTLVMKKMINFEM